MLHLYLYIIIKKLSIICSSETRADDILNNKSYNFQNDSSNVIVQVVEACKEIERKIYLFTRTFLFNPNQGMCECVRVCVCACACVYLKGGFLLLLVFKNSKGCQYGILLHE